MIPTNADAGVASAVAFPSAEVVTATPRCLLDDFYVMRRWILGQELRVVRGAHQLPLVEIVERVGQGHVPMRVMVSVRLAVGGDVDELGAAARIAECAEETMSQVLAAGQEILERHGPCDRAVVEKN